ncbi:hypothetical protein N7445_008336 [Penicillium cf. griseofulvum]|nr:hypothetical protein N7445_008336 [Penicillium cf. griseofulvum]
MGRTGVCLIMCVRRGESKTPRHCTTTVLVVCNSPVPPKHMNDSEANIRKLLVSNNLRQVSFEFVQGDFAWSGSNPNGNELDRRAIRPPSMLGQSLALDGASGSGTFGGFVELKLPGETGYTTMALTCFHSINPSENGVDSTLLGAIRSWRQEGIKPGDSLRTKLQIQQPSSTAVKEKIKSLKDEIRTIEENQQYIDFREVGSKEDIELQLGRYAARMFSNMEKTL